MNFITRHRYSLIFGWIIIILGITYCVNRFNFENNSSVLFLFAVVIVPIIITIVSNFNIKHNKQKYLYSKTNYYDLIKLNINKELVNNLKEITELNIVKDEYIIGPNQRLILTFNQYYCELSIRNTIVSFKYYYSKSFDNLSMYDKRGFEYQSTHILFTELIHHINNLLKDELLYVETKKIQLNYAALLKDDLVLYEYKTYFRNKKSKYTYQEVIKL